MHALAQTTFMPSFNPIRGISSDTLPSQKMGCPFSFTFFNTPAPVVAMAESARVIVERNGIYCIADSFDPSTAALDLDFKRLVDSVMRR
ncbi:MAG: hypothetical protein PUH08_04320 [Treponema sp.]|nr:hypothetical protein [Treponema sp.]MDY4673767.1 hypothetical protein [Treponema sp.]